jgi:hypothetical protein
MITASILVGTPILISLFSEFVSWVNVKSSGTPLSGQGAFLVTLLISIVGGAAYLGYTHIPANYLSGLAMYSTVFLGGATLVFNFIVKTVPGLHFGSTPAPVEPA